MTSVRVSCTISCSTSTFIPLGWSCPSSHRGIVVPLPPAASPSRSSFASNTPWSQTRMSMETDHSFLQLCIWHTAPTRMNALGGTWSPALRGLSVPPEHRDKELDFFSSTSPRQNARPRYLVFAGVWIECHSPASRRSPANSCTQHAASAFPTVLVHTYRIKHKTHPWKETFRKKNSANECTHVGYSSDLSLRLFVQESEVRHDL